MGRVHDSAVTPPDTVMDASLSVGVLTGIIDCGERKRGAGKERDDGLRDQHSTMRARASSERADSTRAAPPPRTLAVGGMSLPRSKYWPVSLVAGKPMTAGPEHGGSSFGSPSGCFQLIMPLHVARAMPSHTPSAPPAPLASSRYDTLAASTRQRSVTAGGPGYTTVDDGYADGVAKGARDDAAPAAAALPHAHASAAAVNATRRPDRETLAAP